jgi:hypothetical protein
LSPDVSEVIPSEARDPGLTDHRPLITGQCL